MSNKQERRRVWRQPRICEYPGCARIDKAANMTRSPGGEWLCRMHAPVILTRALKKNGGKV